MGSSEWVVLELSSQGEDEDPDVLRAALKRAIKGGGADIFIPASTSIVGDSRVVHKLIDNYVFVRRALPDNLYLRLEGTRYVSSVLTVYATGSGTRRIACIKDADIDKMRKQIHVETEQGIEINDEVQVTNGPYKGINGRVIEEIQENDSVQVFIKLRSKQAIVTLPRSFLKFVAKDTSSELPTFAPFRTKITRIREWLEYVRPTLMWSAAGWQPIQRLIAQLGTVSSFGARILQTVEAIRSAQALTLEATGQLFDEVATKAVSLVQMDQYIAKNPKFFGFVSSGNSLDQLNVIRDAVQQKAMEVEWFEGIAQRLAALEDDVTYLERAAEGCKPNMVDNLIIDGHNLAYRIVYAMGNMRTPLTDSEGNPTGLVYGFIKSLGTLRSRYENARITVVWDGSSQYRVKLYEPYKAERRAKRAATGPVIPDKQMARLKAILPMLGVTQAYNSEEEADEVIGSVLARLKGKRNIIVSTDRDFLQLVTYTDLLLVPKVGNSSEVLYDRDQVVTDYKVGPESMVQLRALTGDASDEIPGVPRVPHKVLESLVQTYKTVDAIYNSNLAGITPNQYEKIRTAEDQIRLNTTLMKIRCDIEYTETPPSPDHSAATSALRELNIQPETIGPFFQRSAKGFHKSA